jgi:DNA-binding SARP family transcriptional activator
VIFPTRKTLALLIYLAIEGGMQPRDHLSALLWPESSPERSYANLRNTLGHLQKVLHQLKGQNQTAYLSITHNTLGLNQEADVDFDLKTVEHAYELARADRSSRSLPDGSANLAILQSAASCQRGDFLAGFSLGDAPSFDDWVAIQREVWHRRLSLILDRLSEIQFARGEFAGVTETASHWIVLDALNEVAYRRKMQAHFAAGERGQALETYEACHTLLATELGIEPEPDTAALAERIRTQTSPSHAHINRSVPRPLHSDTSVTFLGNLFAGRTREFQMLVKSSEKALTGQPQLVVLRGEAGIGKTHLARKFLAWASTKRTELLQGGAFESGSHLPFQPLIDALRLRLECENSPTDLLDDVWLFQLSQLLPELTEHYSILPTTSKERNNLPEHPHPKIETSQTLLYEPIVQYSLALAKHTLMVLFIDDLQWADSATLDLLHYAIRRWQANAARVLLFVSLRSEALHPMTQTLQVERTAGLSQWLARVTRELTPIHIELEPLGERETVKLLQSILLPPAPDFAQWLYKETRGQPFYLMETLKDLLERRVLHPKRRAEGQWTFALDAVHDLVKDVRVPSTVHAVIRSRLNRLSPNAFSLLASGAVLEHQITFERMCVISNVDKDIALPALDELISGRLLLEEVEFDVASTYPFVNDMLRDVVYTEAGDARRRLFHQRALEVLEEANEFAAVLAHHAQCAGLTKAAFHYSLIAGREALSISAVREAIIHFEHARQFVLDGVIRYAETDEDLHGLYLLLGKAYKLGGQIEKALAIDAERGRLG